MGMSLQNLQIHNSFFILFYACVAQMARADGFYPSGCRFESCHRYQSQITQIMALFGSRKGCKWWQEVELAKRAERRAELKHRTNPTKANYDA